MNNRLETGIITEKGDWCGLFIRGDDCFEYANAIEIILEENTCENIFILNQLKELMDLMRSTNQGSKEFDSNRLQIVKKL